MGGVTGDAAQATGLLEGTPVIAGSGDTFPTIVGCGAVEAGDAMVSFGTTGLLTITNLPLVKSAAGPHFDASLAGAAVTWGANVLSAGRLVRWYRDQFGQMERAVAERMGDSEFTLMEAEASRTPPGSEGLVVLPHWLGRRTPTNNATLRGAVLGLSPSHTPGHIYRAILEAFAYNIRQGFDVYRSDIKRVVATAGGARSALWRQIVADVNETRMAYHPNASGSLGIAFLAGFGIGAVDDFNAIKYQWLRDPLTIEPQPEAVAVYRKFYSVYCEFDEALASPFANLAAAQEAGS